MLNDGPEGWLNYLQKYVKADMIVTDFFDDVGGRSPMLEKVLLKNFHCSINTNYFVRPGQHLGETKFRSEKQKDVYRKIKALKTILKIEGHDNVMLKKMLLRSVELYTEEPPQLLYSVMLLPELREKFQVQLIMRRIC
jgi:hypothetical protein